MAQATFKIIEALRKTASRIYLSTNYQWGHMGLCNCGFLAQEITQQKKEEIHQKAMLRSGDWTEQLNDYCPTSGLPMDDLISDLLAYGFSADDLKHLERLSDPQVLNTLPFEERDLKYNTKHDVIKYIQAWAAKLENELIAKITLPALTETVQDQT